ncbi:hypothetical protein jhhlp_000862 [Lomentospora prolificans]|uniref:Heterokaryon incompatibility domain-containing protein n=1 Tax=Lomentospora prolificans TaxID=41688 RepID=A0A2N3NJQ3_9PEZI|nr:hypothetical protein jhhlp_000862 [Lomentospora prolificans]
MAAHPSSNNSPGDHGVRCCSACADSISAPEYRAFRVLDITTFEQLTQGCPVCIAIRIGLDGLRSRLSMPEIWWQKANLTIFRFHAYKNESFSFVARVNLSRKEPVGKSRQTGHLDGTNEYLLFTEPDALLARSLSRGVARNIAPHSESEECFQLIRDWIADCDTHLGCTTSPAAPPLPTRVLDLGAGGSETVKLYVTQSETGLYIVLSHCWGPKGLPAAATTTRRSYQDRLKGIDVGSLPATFRDAVQICRKLGIRYLWIDSLCIIQEDAEDWDLECSRMADVYGNAYLSISAAGAASSNEGCFAARPPAQLSMTVGAVNFQGFTQNIMARRCINHGFVGPYVPEETETPLWTRAWTLQERLLPRRVIHYCKRELVWECRSLTDCECGAGPWAYDNGAKVETSTKLHFSSILGKLDSEDEFRERWGQVVSRFSMMKLTHDSDRLPALSGLAQKVGSAQTGRYLAGLWEKHLPWMLGWSTLNLDGQPCRSSTVPTPPTWSWASVEKSDALSWELRSSKRPLDMQNWLRLVKVWHGDRDIVQDHSPMMPQWATVKNVRYNPLGVDRMGRVAEGILTLSSLAVSAQVAIEDEAEAEDDHSHSSDNRVSYVCTRGGVSVGLREDIPLDMKSYQSNPAVTCLIVGSGLDVFDSVKVLCLVLRAKPDKSKTTGEIGRKLYFERIGTFTETIRSLESLNAWTSWWSSATETTVNIV